MPTINVRAVNYNCNRCKQQPIFECQPCGHQICYDHYLGKNWSLEQHEECCVHCGQHVENIVELEQPAPVLETVSFLDTTWHPNQPRDHDTEWSQADEMYGNLGDMNGYPNGSPANGNGRNGNNGNYYAHDSTGFPTLLRGGGRSFPPSALPPPGDDGANNIGGAYRPTPSSGYGRPPSSALGPPPRSFNATPSLYGGSSSFNPGAPRYIPAHLRDEQPHMVDPIVRPESSISNHTYASNNTFATQMPRSHMQMADMAAPVPRRAYPQAFGNGMNGLGAGLNNLNISNFQAPSTINEGSEVGLGGYNGALTRRSNGSSNEFRAPRSNAASSRFLAEEIMDGKTEDPHDRSMKQYDIPAKLPPPMMGPARFKDTRMFSIYDAKSTGDVQNAKPHVQQELPPAPKPDWLDLATRGMMKPNLEEVFEALPFVELTRTINPSNGGVVRISDIPYVATKQEMTAFLGRQAQINRMPEGSPYHAVHILMERESGKTQDCFVEMATPNEAAWVVRQINKRLEAGRPPKVGERVVKVTNSSQDELMTELFPRAKHVKWHKGQPIVDQSRRMYYENTAADGFSGFVHSEEFHAMEKHANLNDRAPFSSKSPCRVYECMITMLYKYPWYATDLVTVGERRFIFDTASHLVKTLCYNLRSANNKFKPLDPTPALLQELVSACLYCPGFSERQKSYISDNVKGAGFTSIANGRGVNIRLGGSHPLAPHWPFSTLSMHPDVDYKLVEYYAGLFREASAAQQPSNGGSLAARQMAKATGYEMEPMGNFTIDYGRNLDKLSLEQVAKIEYGKIEQLLSMVCSRPGQEGKPPSAPNSVGPDYTTGRGSSGSSAGARSLF